MPRDGRPDTHLRVCASTDMVEDVLDRLPVSAEPERTRYAAVGRALADPKRLCVLESLAIGELSVGDLSDPGRLPGAQHEPASRGAAQCRPRDHPARRQHGLLPPRGPAGPRGLSTHPGHRPLRASHSEGTGPHGRDQGRHGRDIRGARPQAERPVVVDFWAAWCGPCKMVAPEMEKLAKKYDGAVDVVKVDVDANPGLSQAFNILSIPDDRLLQAGRAAAGRRRLPTARAARADLRPRRVRPRRRRLTSPPSPTPTPVTDRGRSIPGSVARTEASMSRRQPGDGTVGGVVVELGRCERDPAWPAAATARRRASGRRRRRRPGRARIPRERPSAATTANGRPSRDHVVAPSAAEPGLDVVRAVRRRRRGSPPGSTGDPDRRQDRGEVVAMSLVVARRLVIDEALSAPRS